MSAPTYTTPASSSPIAVDTDDPNTTEPGEERLIQPPSGQDRVASPMYCCPTGGAMTLQLWAKLPQLGRWVKIGAAQACPADTLTYLPATPPTGIGTLYLQVTANTAGTQYVAGWQGQR